MRYLPNSPAERKAMLEATGHKSIEELFDQIPAELKLQGSLNLPGPLSEAEILEYFKQAASQSGREYVSLLGAGAYSHYRPVAIDALLSRGEFFTAYTPYQAEIAQGTLQAMFEFQTLITQLTGMDVANASLYDGSTATTEAVLMALRITRRNRVILARTLHPEYRQVLQAYVQHQGVELVETPYASTGQLDVERLEAFLKTETAAVVIQSPNFFGTIERAREIAEIVHRSGALLIVTITEPLSLAIVQPPVDADIVCGEAQSFGVPVAFGGPYVGFLGAKEQFIRQMPGRLIGQTQDTEGRRGFVLTLATREQHIRREKATSNICTNQALVALMVNIFMTVYGKVGLRELAKQNLAKTAYAAAQFAKHGKVLFAGTPRFNEFVVQTSEDPYAINSRLLGHKMVGGLPLKKFYPELGNAALWCCTELTTRSAIDTAVGLVAESERSVRPSKEEDVAEVAR